MKLRSFLAFCNFYQYFNLDFFQLKKLFISFTKKKMFLISHLIINSFLIT